jgi:L,D-transpeptidase catalytic domain
MGCINKLTLVLSTVLLGSIFVPPGAFSGETAEQPTAAIKSLRPGEYIWRPELSPDGPVVVVVSLPEQLTHIYRNGVAIGVSTSSTGKPGKRTPTGVFTILQKRERHFSSTYNNAPMPNMQRLTWRGIALHAGNLPGYPASMGCIRLPMEFSKHLFSVTHLGTPVIIADQKTKHSDLVNPGLILSNNTTKLAKNAIEKAKGKKPPKTQNTSSILISSADRKAYLMTDGKIVYETPVRIKDPSRPLGNHLYSLLGPSPDGKSFRWAAFGFGGQPGEGQTVDRWNDETLGRIEVVDKEGALEVASKLQTGTTMLITDFAAGPETRSGPDFTVIVEDTETKGKRRKATIGEWKTFIR